MCICKTICPQLHAYPYKMTKIDRYTTVIKLTWFYSKVNLAIYFLAPESSLNYKTPTLTVIKISCSQEKLDKQMDEGPKSNMLHHLIRSSEYKQKFPKKVSRHLTLLLLNMTCPVLANNADPDQLASEANWSRSALFIIKYVNFCQKLGSSNLIGWKLEGGMAS